MIENGLAVIFLIDNSDTSMNGDFHPNRLEAQRNAVIKLDNHYRKKTSKIQIGIGTLGKNCAGICASLTSDQTKIFDAVNKVQRGGCVKLMKGIRSAFLAHRHSDQEIRNHSVIVFIGSKHNLNQEDVNELTRIANSQQISVSIVAFGDDVNDLLLLQSFVQNLQTQPSHFIHAPSGSLILSDIVLRSPLGPGDTLANPSMEEDPEFAYAVKLSMNDDIDTEFQAALKASLNDSLPVDDDDETNDPDLQEAINLSMQEHQPDDKIPNERKKNTPQ